MFLVGKRKIMVMVNRFWKLKDADISSEEVNMSLKKIHCYYILNIILTTVIVLVII